jgi:tetratricopeptide (TPR) repeat protein
LIDASNGTHIWADRFEGGLESVFDLQDDVTSRVVAAISQTVEQAEVARSRRKPTQDLRAYDYYLRAVALLSKPSYENSEEGLWLLGKAIGLDNEFALAMATAGNFYVQRKVRGLDVEPEKDKVEAERLARRALELDPRDPRVLERAGYALVLAVGLIEEGIGYIDQAVEIDSNLAAGWTKGGYARLYLGRDSIDYFEKAIRLNPLDPLMYSTLNGLAHAHCIAGHYDEAVVWAEKSLRHRATFANPYWALIVSHVLAGRMEKAKQAWTMYQKVEPTASISNVQARMGTPVQEFLDKYAEALRAVGVPE